MKSPFAPGTFAALALAIMVWVAPAAALPADFETRANAYLESAYPPDGPGAAVIVTQGGRTVYVRGRGLADIEAGTPIGPETVFRLGSITKQFAAAIILQLADEGRLSLDDPVSRFLPDYPAPGSGATVRQLLNHTGGIQSYTGIPGWMAEANTNRAYTTDELVAVFRDLPAPSQPGQVWAYNNSGYVLLGAIIERVTGMAWDRAVAERIARPLGLTTIRSGIGEENVPHMARGYTGSANAPQPSQLIHMSVPHAAGALIGTVGDLAIWAQALHHGRVVGAESYAAMIAPTAMPDWQSVPYGYGLAPGDVRGRPAIGHSGGIFGFATDSIYIPEADLFVAILANSDQAATPTSVAMRRLAAMALDDPYPVFERAPADQAAIEPLLGVYALADGSARTFFARGDRLFTRRDSGPETEVFAAGEDRFFYGPANLTWFRVVRDAGDAHVMEMHQDGAAEGERATRRGPAPVEAAAVEVAAEILARHVGSYAFSGINVAVTQGGNKLMIQLTGQPRFDMTTISENEFSIPQVGARIVFHQEDGRTTHLVIHQGGQEIRADRTES